MLDPRLDATGRRDPCVALGRPLRVRQSPVGERPSSRGGAVRRGRGAHRQPARPPRSNHK
eukprot:1503374-Pyramimonas_sp.AAC.1